MLIVFVVFIFDNAVSLSWAIIPFVHTYTIYVMFTDEKDKQLCTPLLKAKSERSTQQEAQPTPLDLHAIDANIATDHYESVTQFDVDVNGVFSAVIREQGRSSTLGMVAVQLKKVRYKHANQVNNKRGEMPIVNISVTILGPTVIRQPLHIDYTIK